MGYSNVTYEGTGLVSSYAYGSIELFSNSEILHKDQLLVYIDGELLTFTTDYTLDTVNEEIDLVAPLGSGETLLIQRSTEIDERLVDFTNNTIIEAETLDLDSNQLFFLIQELADSQSNALTLDSDNYWDGEGHASRNCSPADSGSGWVTLQQMQDAIAGVDTATVDGATQWSFTGNGVLTDFTLTGLGLNVTAAQLWVWQNGVIQKPVDDYDIDNTGTDPVVEFVAAPAGGDTIEIRAVHGTVTAIFDEVDGSIINDYSIDPLTALKTSAGDNTRFIIIGSSGKVSQIVQLVTAYIQDFDSAVEAKKLNDFDTPDGNISMGGNQITSMASGSASGHAVNKGQMEAAIAAAASLKVASGSMGTVSTSGISITVGFQPTMITLIKPTSGQGNAEVTFRSDYGGLSVSEFGTTINLQFNTAGFGFTPGASGEYWYIAYE